MLILIREDKPHRKSYLADSIDDLAPQADNLIIEDQSKLKQFALIHLAAA
jgi:hypothetical protein